MTTSFTYFRFQTSAKLWKLLERALHLFSTLIGVSTVAQLELMTPRMNFCITLYLMANNKPVEPQAIKTSSGLVKIARSVGILKVFGSREWMAPTSTMPTEVTNLSKVYSIRWSLQLTTTPKSVCLDIRLSLNIQIQSKAKVIVPMSQRFDSTTTTHTSIALEVTTLPFSSGRLSQLRVCQV